MISRRDLMKFFGVGASVVPIVGTEPLMEATSTILAPPAVMLAAPPSIVEPGFRPSGACTMTVELRNPNGDRWVYEMRTIVQKCEPIEVQYEPGDTFRRYRPGPMTFQIEGDLIATVRNVATVRNDGTVKS